VLKGVISPKRRSRIGFTLAEVVVALAIVAIISAVVVWGVTPQIARSQNANLLQELRAITQGIQAFRENVGRYPSSISYLSDLPSNATDACGASIPDANEAQWRGPYISGEPLVGGLPAGDATVTLPLFRDPATPTIPTDMEGTLRIRTLQVDKTTYDRIEQEVDGYSELSNRDQTGAIQWSQSGGTGFGTYGTLDFFIPVKGC
jgi:general secretion pathway protein G